MDNVQKHNNCVQFMYYVHNIMVSFGPFANVNFYDIIGMRVFIFRDCPILIVLYILFRPIARNPTRSSVNTITSSCSIKGTELSEQLSDL
jgi:hypothetical protein